jgi:purine-binding chemotaxis protein CheW
MTAPPLGFDEIQATLQERARELARPIAAVEDGDFVDMAIVECGSERFAMDVSCLREVRAVPLITGFPSLPPVWSGLMNLRGALCPVLDLPRYLGVGAREEGADHHDVVVVQSASGAIGLRVDRVSEVRRMRKTDVGPAAGSASDVVRGITADLTSVIDVEALLEDPALIVQEGAA